MTYGNWSFQTVSEDKIAFQGLQGVSVTQLCYNNIAPYYSFWSISFFQSLNL